MTDAVKILGCKRFLELVCVFHVLFCKLPDWWSNHQNSNFHDEALYDTLGYSMGLGDISESASNMSVRRPRLGFAGSRVRILSQKNIYRLAAHWVPTYLTITT